MTPEALRITPSQMQTYEQIKAFMVEHGRAPTFGELAERLGLKHRSAVVGRLASLRARGVVEWDHRRACSIRLLDQPTGAYVLPNDLQRRLEDYCGAHDEDLLSVVVDAVALHLDAVEKAP
jgi:SOS-response transcriptional repressor LexA